MPKSLTFYLRVVGLMAVSLMLSSLVSNTVFLAATPQFNTHFLAKYWSTPGSFFTDTQSYVAALSGGGQSTTNFQAKRQVESSDVASGDYTAEGYTQKTVGLYEKQNVSANALQIAITSDAKFEKKHITVGDQEVDAWVPVVAVAP